MTLSRVLCFAIALMFSTSTIARTLVVSAVNANIRSGPGTEYQVLTIAPNGTTFHEIGESGKWFRVPLSAGKEGWVSQSAVRIEADQTSEQGKKPCRAADAGAVATGALGAKLGFGAAVAVCCAATLGFGCIACVVGGTAIGAVGGAKTGEAIGEATCK